MGKNKSSKNSNNKNNSQKNMSGANSCNENSSNMNENNSSSDFFRERKGIEWNPPKKYQCFSERWQNRFLKSTSFKFLKFSHCPKNGISQNSFMGTNAGNQTGFAKGRAAAARRVVRCFAPEKSPRQRCVRGTAAPKPPAREYDKSRGFRSFAPP